MRKLLVIACAALSVAGALRAGLASEPSIERASVSTAGAEGNLDSTGAAVSAGSRYVAFSSDATNFLVPDLNSRDIFRHDRETGATVAASTAGGTQANAPALSPSISGDGALVVFASDAGNLVAEDAAVESDVFVRDFAGGGIERVSVASDGGEGNGDSETPSISADGRFVTFTSRADNLVPDDENEDRDVFVHDRVTGATELVSKATDGTRGNFASGGVGAGPARISGSGRYVVFGSFADNLVGDDGNGSDDAFLHDRETGATERLSVASDGSEGEDHSYYPSVSDDGRYAVFYSDAENLVANDGNGAADVFLRDRQVGTTARLSVGMGGAEADGPSRFPVISGDGRFVAFESTATNLVPGDTGTSDIFLLDRQSGAIERLTDGDGPSRRPSIDGTGSVVAFESTATDLVANDGNGRADVFARGKALGPPPTPSPTPPPTATPCVRDGDVNEDGQSNALDALLILQFSAALLPGLPDREAADLNDDGSISAIDAFLLLQFTAGLIPLPC